MKSTCITFCMNKKKWGIKQLPLISSTDAVILLWKLNDSKELEPLVFQDEDEAQLNKENWAVIKTLR